MKVIKRDGTPQEYNFLKIMDAVDRAFNSVSQSVPEKFIEQLKESVEKRIIKNNGDGTPIEEIQDVIQKELIKRNKFEVVESFINYRRKREEIREQKSDLIKQIQDKLSAKNVQNQNANLDEESFGGRLGETAEVVSKDIALKLMSKTSRKNHENNEVYIHDLGHYRIGDHNCLTYPMDKSLNKGFNTRQTDVRPAGSVNTAMQLVAVLFQLQSLQQFGGVSASHLDWTMVPFVRKSYRKHYIAEWIKDLDEFYDLDILSLPYDEYKHWVSNKTTEFYLTTGIKDSDFKFANKNLDKRLRQKALDDTKRETYQAVEGMYHNLNTLQSRSGSQLPFSSINYGTCTELEGRMVTKALLEVSMEGLGSKGVTSIFPCGIFQYKKGINDKPGTPNYDLKRLALKSTSMRIYPNYANCDWSNQVAWVNKDRDMKREYLASLDDDIYAKLLNNLKDNIDVAYTLGLVINGDAIEVDQQERPIEFFSTMGCRTANGLNINAMQNFKRNIQCVIDGNYDEIDDVFSGAQKDGRGNICPVTIILPTLAMMTKQKVDKKLNGDETDEEKYHMYHDEFFKLLTKKLYEAKDTLLERFNHIASQSPAAAKFMYENGTMAGYHKEEGIISALKGGTLTLGQLGVAEALIILFGFDHTTEKGLEIAEEIEKLYDEKSNEFKKEYSLNFANYYTPAENLCYTAMKNFKKRFKDFEQENVTYTIEPVMVENEEGRLVQAVDENGKPKFERTEKMFFTNSIHVPVWHDLDAFKKIDIESKLTKYGTGGCITYVELPAKCYHNIDAVEEVVDYAMEHDVPYFAINIPLNRCACCGEPIYDESKGCCPKCGCEKIIRLGRITGYLSTTVEHFNKGKQQEFGMRKKHFKN